MIENVASAESEIIDKVLDASGDALALVEARRGVVAWNAAAEALAGMKREAVVGRTPAELDPALAAALGLPDPLAASLEQLRAPRSGVAPLFGRAAVAWQLSPCAGRGARVAVCRLREEDAGRGRGASDGGEVHRLKDFVEAASDWFWEMDAELRYSYFSDRYYEATGLPPGSRLGKRRGDFRLLGRDDGDWETHLADLTARRPFRDFTFAYVDAHDRRRVARVSGRPVFDAAGAFLGYRGVGRDITDAVQAEARIRHLAQHDPLTDLPNRTLFQDRLGQAIAGARRHHGRMALLCLDLDDFKGVNDSLGHAAGDRLLCETAARMRALVRQTDTVARLGGDEFAVIQVDLASCVAAAELAERLVRGLAEPMRLLDGVVSTSASLGVAVYPDDGDDPESLLRHADLALYRAKALGRNGFQLYRPELGREHARRRQLEAELRHALERDSLTLSLEPSMDVTGGRLAAIEASLHWAGGGEGVVSPAMLVQLAERCGLVTELGRALLGQACARAAAWRRGGLQDVRLSLNLAASQLARSDLVRDVEAALARSGLEPTALELEIDESILAAGQLDLAPALAELAGMGIGFALDHFGTGYCPLPQLRRLPLRALKIDASVVRGLSGAEGDAAIARALIGLGNQLGLRVTALGVESPGQLAALAACGCDEAQGPVVASLDELLAARAAPQPQTEDSGPVAVHADVHPALHPVPA